MQQAYRRIITKDKNGDLVRETVLDTITPEAAKRRRYGLADDAPDSDVIATEAAAQTVVEAQETSVDRANRIPKRFVDYDPRSMIDEIKQAQNALDSLTLTTARLFFRTTFKALLMLIINQHQIMVALRLTQRQITEE